MKGALLVVGLVVLLVEYSVVVMVGMLEKRSVEMLVDEMVVLKVA